MIQSVLIANRGEIALRIMRTCRRLGIRTVAVYSDADAHALHVAEADAAFWIGPSPAAASYLNQARILEVARLASAAAIHPGYGFLAENADFAEACRLAGRVWIGPTPQAMRALGDKASARSLAERHGVPLLPGYHGDDQSAGTLARHAEGIGYPVLIKASAGGGGRGMRVVESAAGFASGLEAAKRESLASFGNDRVLLERYIQRPRHVEVQIFGDQHGNLIHLGERECSVQRRHQKLIEESPSPAVDAGLRARMGEAALQLARASGYSSAGTVEFLLDQLGQFAFLEVNARLQVEHPVTEAVTGLDLVELQLLVASGDALPIGQADIRSDGHAIEARVIAEDPLAAFLPSSGTLESFVRPPLVRVDTWVQDGTRISPYYDSLLAKVVARGPTRAAALDQLAGALSAMRVDGINNNIDLLLAVVQHRAFRDGQLDTGFLEHHHVLDELASIPPAVLAAASALECASTPARADPWRARSSWRLGRTDQPVTWTRAGRAHPVHVSAELGGAELGVKIGSASVGVQLLPTDGGPRRRVRVYGETLTVAEDGTQWRVVEWAGRLYRLRRANPLSVAEAAGVAASGGGPGRLTAPMPGRVVKIGVQAGERVVQNQALIVLEAMKMEHVVEAPHAGLVAELCVHVGEQVASGAQLLVLGSADAEDGPK